MGRDLDPPPQEKILARWGCLFPSFSPLNPVRRSGERCKFPQLGLEKQSYCAVFNTFSVE